MFDVRELRRRPETFEKHSPIAREGDIKSVMRERIGLVQSGIVSAKRLFRQEGPADYMLLFDEGGHFRGRAWCGNVVEVTMKLLREEYGVDDANSRPDPNLSIESHEVLLYPSSDPNLFFRRMRDYDTREHASYSLELSAETAHSLSP